jgi:hypothetical protein
MTTNDLQTTSRDKKARLKMIRTWLVLIGSVLFWIVFWAVYQKAHPARHTEPPVSFSGDKGDLFAHVFVMGFLSVLSLAFGIGGYFLVIFTECLTFNFSRPIWEAVKVKMWFANLFVILAIGLGIGFFASALVTPMLTQAGVSPEFSGFLPIIVSLGLIQLLFVWFLIWAPLEKRVIARRLKALGITPEQMQTGIYLGLSDPDQRSVSKRFAAIEEDIGMLWFGPEHLIYYGDSRQINITRAQLISVERLVDGRSSTALSGTAHVILNYYLPDGSTQRVRLHTEGVKTMGGKRTAMEALNGRIEAWRAAQQAPLAAIL